MEFYCHDLDRDVMVLSADGGLNRQNADEFTLTVQRIVESGADRLIIDCSRLEYLSSVGISALMLLNKRMREKGGDVKVCAVRGMVAQALALTRLNRVFEIYSDIERARLAFRSRSESGPAPA